MDESFYPTFYDGYSYLSMLVKGVPSVSIDGLLLKRYDSIASTLGYFFPLIHRNNDLERWQNGCVNIIVIAWLLYWNSAAGNRIKSQENLSSRPGSVHARSPGMAGMGDEGGEDVPPPREPTPMPTQTTFIQAIDFLLEVKAMPVSLYLK